jgi:hypothetical protein
MRKASPSKLTAGHCSGIPGLFEEDDKEGLSADTLLVFQALAEGLQAALAGERIR